MARGDKLALLKKAITNMSLTAARISAAYPSLNAAYVASMYAQVPCIEKDGKCKQTGRWRYRYNPKLDVPGQQLTPPVQPANSIREFGNSRIMLPDKLACIRRRIASNYTSEKDKDILQAIYRDYQGLVRSGVGS